jgi:hypothetical protein
VEILRSIQDADARAEVEGEGFCVATTSAGRAAGVETWAVDVGETWARNVVLLLSGTRDVGMGVSYEVEFLNCWIRERGL